MWKLHEETKTVFSFVLPPPAVCEESFSGFTSCRSWCAASWTPGGPRRGTCIFSPYWQRLPPAVGTNSWSDWGWSLGTPEHPEHTNTHTKRVWCTAEKLSGGGETTRTIKTDDLLSAGCLEIREPGKRGSSWMNKGPAVWGESRWSDGTTRCPWIFCRGWRENRAGEFLLLVLLF